MIAFAKKTGDYAVLSQTDLSVIALTYQYEVEANGEEHIRSIPGQAIPQSRSLQYEIPSSGKPLSEVVSTLEGDLESNSPAIIDNNQNIPSIEQVLLETKQSDISSDHEEDILANTERITEQTNMSRPPSL